MGVLLSLRRIPATRAGTRGSGLLAAQLILCFSALGSAAWLDNRCADESRSFHEWANREMESGEESRCKGVYTAPSKPTHLVEIDAPYGCSSGRRGPLLEALDWSWIICVEKDSKRYVLEDFGTPYRKSHLLFSPRTFKVTEILEIFRNRIKEHLERSGIDEKDPRRRVLLALHRDTPWSMVVKLVDIIESSGYDYVSFLFYRRHEKITRARYHSTADRRIVEIMSENVQHDEERYFELYRLVHRTLSTCPDAQREFIQIGAWLALEHFTPISSPLSLKMQECGCDVDYASLKATLRVMFHPWYYHAVEAEISGDKTGKNRILLDADVPWSLAYEHFIWAAENSYKNRDPVVFLSTKSAE
jgi:hypothetical protein